MTLDKPSFHSSASDTNTTKAKEQKSWVPILLIGIAIAYLALVQYIPAINVFTQAFSKGVGPFFANLSQPAFLHAAWLTLLLALISLPVNTVFGLCAAWAIARRKFPGRAVVLSIIDLPFSISPVVAGLMIVLLYGRNGWFGPWLQAHDIRIIFA
ncbi:MAG: sulfate ABC transporter permease subunit CysW, partial [Nostoc sp. C3-bin3]|nr:sulfate ABC transporter permease subunit CysW [Nostoc sp. C3-bin3]